MASPCEPGVTPGTPLPSARVGRPGAAVGRPADKDDLFKTLLRDALHDMEIITGDFPVVTHNEAGHEALRTHNEAGHEALRRGCQTGLPALSVDVTFGDVGYLVPASGGVRFDYTLHRAVYMLLTLWLRPSRRRSVALL